MNGSLRVRKIGIAALLIFIGIVARIWLYKFLPSTPHIYITLHGIKQPLFMMDMFFIIAAISLISGKYLGGYSGFIIPFSIMAITDFIIGNNIIFLFTWSGFAMMGFIGYLMRKKTFLKFYGYSLFAIILYDIWTNFGCWVGWYSHDLQGLMLCYTLALPFMFWHIISTLAILPAFAIPFEKANLIASEKALEKYATISSTIFLMALSITAL